MASAVDLTVYASAYAEFFHQLPAQSRAWSFAAPELSSGKFPLQAEEIILAPLADENAAALFDNRRYNANHVVPLYPIAAAPP
jgi:hypothetical protein